MLILYILVVVVVVVEVVVVVVAAVAVVVAAIVVMLHNLPSLCEAQDPPSGCGWLHVSGVFPGVTQVNRRRRRSYDRYEVRQHKKKTRGKLKRTANQ